MEQLLASIDRHGVQVPIVVYEDDGRYVLIDGERRWRCARKLNLKAIPALVQEKPGELENLLLMYNIHSLREQWDYYTIASKLTRIITLYAEENGKRPTEDELSGATGLTRGQIRRCRLLLDLPEKYKDLLLAELGLPKSRQKLTEDFFIEMERSLKTVTKRIPEYETRIDQIRDVLVGKFRNGRIEAVTDFRQLSKIATAVNNLGLELRRAKRSIDKVFDPADETGIRDAYAATVAFGYDEHEAYRYAESLNTFITTVLEQERVGELEDEFRTKLRELYRHLRKLLGS